MEKKRSVGVVVVIYCLSNILVVSSCFSQGLDDEAIFKERVYKYFRAPLNLDFSTSKQGEKAHKDLLNFSEEFPDSKYADDAQFIVLTEASGGEVKTLAAIEEFVKQYPDGKLENSTIKYLKETFNGDIPNELFVPYDLLLTFYKAQYAFQRDIAQGIKYCSEFIENFKYKNNDEKKALRPIYVRLLVGYKMLNEKNKYETTKSQMIILFPEEQKKLEQF